MPGRMLARCLFIPSLLCASCARIHNDRLTVAGEAMPALASTPGDRLAESTGPSLSNGSREYWERVSILVGVDGTEHHPHYTDAMPNYSKTPRARGVHPDATSAAALGGPAGPMVWEGLAAPFHAAADVVLFIPRLFITPPCAVVSSPVDRLERCREGGAFIEAAPELAPEKVPINEDRHPS